MIISLKLFHEWELLMGNFPLKCEEFTTLRPEFPASIGKNYQLLNILLVNLYFLGCRRSLCSRNMIVAQVFSANYSGCSSWCFWKKFVIALEHDHHSSLLQTFFTQTVAQDLLFNYRFQHKSLFYVDYASLEKQFKDIKFKCNYYRAAAFCGSAKALI